MSDAFSVLFPRDGDVLNRRDGAESAEGLAIVVRGVAPAGAEVLVDGVAAARDGNAFSGEVALRQRHNSITIACGGESRELGVFWNKGSRKRFRFSVDDNIQFLKDLGSAPDDYASLFNHWYLAFWLDMHRSFGAKIHFNIYYQTDDFDLTQMPATWRDEWEANADWLHVTFHALQDKPDRPYRHADYEQAAHDYELVTRHIRRFAGDRVIGNTTTVHWAEMPKDGVRALRDRGMARLIALFDHNPCTTGYYLPQEQCDYCDTRGAWYDRETDVTFIRCASVINSLKVEEIVPTLEKRTATPQTEDMLELLIHEQYFRKDLPELYQPDVMDKVRTALNWATQHGYAPVFWSEGYLGSPE